MRKLATVQPRTLQEPIFWPGGATSLFPYSGSRTEAARYVAALICPPTNAPDAHTDNRMVWPCLACRLWAEEKISTLVEAHLNSKVVPDAPSPRRRDSQKAGTPPKRSTQKSSVRPRNKLTRRTHRPRTD